MGYLKNVSRRGFVKGAGVAAAAATMAGLAGCSGGDSGSASGDSVKIEMVTDTGGRKRPVLQPACLGRPSAAW